MSLSASCRIIELVIIMIVTLVEGMCNVKLDPIVIYKTIQARSALTDLW